MPLIPALRREAEAGRSLLEANSAYTASSRLARDTSEALSQNKENKQKEAVTRPGVMI